MFLCSSEMNSQFCRIIIIHSRHSTWSLTQICGSINSKQKSCSMHHHHKLRNEQIIKLLKATICLHENTANHYWCNRQIHILTVSFFKYFLWKNLTTDKLWNRQHTAWKTRCVSNIIFSFNHVWPFIFSDTSSPCRRRPPRCGTKEKVRNLKSSVKRIFPQIEEKSWCTIWIRVETIRSF